MTDKRRSAAGGGRPRGNSRRPVSKKRRKSYRQKVVAIQIAAITLAIFCLLIVAAVILTKVFATDRQGTSQTSGEVWKSRRKPARRGDRKGRPGTQDQDSQTSGRRNPVCF